MELYITGSEMRMIGSAKEIADLVREIQDRQKEELLNTDEIIHHLREAIRDTMQ